MGHLYHGYVSHRGYLEIWRSFAWIDSEKLEGMKWQGNIWTYLEILKVTVKGCWMVLNEGPDGHQDRLGDENLPGKSLILYSCLVVSCLDSLKQVFILLKCKLFLVWWIHYRNLKYRFLSCWSVNLERMSWISEPHRERGEVVHLEGTRCESRGSPSWRSWPWGLGIPGLSRIISRWPCG